MIAAFINLAPRLARFRLPLAFGFGLVHGFGFANALAGLDSGGATLPALAGFNVGVELANLAVIAAVLPVIAVARAPSLVCAARAALALARCRSDRRDLAVRAALTAAFRARAGARRSRRP